MQFCARIICFAVISTAASISSQNSQVAFSDNLQPSIASKPIAAQCKGYPSPSIICLNRYGSVLQSGFKRTVRSVLGDADTYRETYAPNNPSFRSIGEADFLVLDPRRASELLGSNPSNDFMFTLAPHSHEAPIYIPDTNEFMFSSLENHYLPQLYINLTANPPTISEKTAHPPIYAPTGARYKDGLIYVSTIGGDDDFDGAVYRPGIYTIDPLTGKSETLLNNYFGWYFNSIDDFDIDKDNNFWFTDNYYGRPCHVNDRAPMIHRATYRFDLDTGLVVVAEDSLLEPNGAQLSLDEKKLFLTDTGAGISNIDPNLAAADVPPIVYNATGVRTIYSYDIDTTVDSYGDKSKRLINKTPIHYSMDYAPDGIKISREGYLVTAAGRGITVLTQTGRPVLRVQTNFTVINMAWAGSDMGELWAVGIGGVQRIRLGIKGPLL